MDVLDTSGGKGTLKKLFFFLGILLSVSPFISEPIALLLGLMVALFVGHPYLYLNNKATQYLLQVSVVGLGFGMQLDTALEAGKEGFLFTVITIVGTLVVGYFLGKLFKIDKVISYLIASGTAICGGSAIAAVSPIIKANEKQISVALGIVFILNALALFVFPFIGEYVEMTQSQFGLWSAIAIHDTSSVVGAASKFGPEALEVATTVKLARALWIIPLAIASTFFFKSPSKKIKIPYFIGFFVLAMIANTYIPFVEENGHHIASLARTGLKLTLFLIGCGLSKKVVKSVGVKPFAQGAALWLLISAVSLWSILTFTG
jgi:uncharacterized integral membrane protein (TIGR00698 family)